MILHFDWAIFNGNPFKREIDKRLSATVDPDTVLSLFYAVIGQSCCRKKPFITLINPIEMCNLDSKPVFWRQKSCDM